MVISAEKGSNATRPAPLFASDSGVTLVGAGALGSEDLVEAMSHAPRLVAADGGAAAVLAAGHRPEAVIGDMDSLSPEAREALGDAVLHPIAEQESTDFDKALRHLQAPFVLAVGFTGARADHELAAYHSLIRWPEPPAILLGPEDLVLHVPRALSLNLAEGTRVSLFPLGPVTGRSEGLRWSIAGLAFDPMSRIGTSNMATGGPVRLDFDGPGMLLILPRVCLPAVIAALTVA